MPNTAIRLAGNTDKPLPRRFTFTLKSLERLTCPAGKGRVWVYDTKVNGLAFCLTASGAKGFYVVKKMGGTTVKPRIGGMELSLDKVRKKAIEDLVSIGNGINPAAQRRAIHGSITLKELFERYTQDHAQLRATERTRVTDKSRFDTCFDDWENKKIGTIKENHVRAKHTDIGRERGQITANRAIQLLRRMFNWARIEPNPARNGVVDFFPEHERERFLQADELPRFFKALDAETNTTIRDFVYMSLWSGARRANVLSMRWDEVNAASATWTIPAGKSKSGEAMTVHLSAPALAILKERSDNGSDYVFPGRGKSGHLEEPKGAWKNILEAAGIKNLRLHDLRRTLGSWQGAAGASLQIIGRSLGHHDVATTAIYSRLDLTPVRASVDAATAAMQAAVEAAKAAAAATSESHSDAEAKG